MNVAQELLRLRQEDAQRWAVLNETLQRLTMLPSQLRQSLADQLWARMAANLFEYAFSASATQVNVQPITNEIEVITAIYAWCPAGESGYIQLGNTTIIPVAGGPTMLPFIRITLAPGDTRSLTVGTPGGALGSAGVCGLYLFGEPGAAYGHLPT